MVSRVYMLYLYVYIYLYVGLQQQSQARSPAWAKPGSARAALDTARVALPAVDLKMPFKLILLA